MLKFITNLISEEIAPKANQGGACAAQTSVLATLGYMASPAFQMQIGDILGLSQQTVSRCVRKVTLALQGRAGQFIYFPRNEEVCFKILIAFIRKYK
jgi:hypothetical protein